MTRTGPLAITLLRSLSADGPQTSMELTRRLDPYPGKKETQARDGVNQRLAVLRAAGHAEVAGTIPTAYNNIRAFLWQITPAGEHRLATWGDHKSKAAEFAERQAQHQERNQALLRQVAREARENGWGPATPTAERRVIARRLRARGLPYRWIGAVFGVSREMIRLDCMGIVQKNGSRYRAEPAVLPPPEGPGKVWARTRERAG